MISTYATSKWQINYESDKCVEIDKICSEFGEVVSQNFVGFCFLSEGDIASCFFGLVKSKMMRMRKTNY